MGADSALRQADLCYYIPGQIPAFFANIYSDTGQFPIPMIHYSSTLRTRNFSDAPSKKHHLMGQAAEFRRRRRSQ